MQLPASLPNRSDLSKLHPLPPNVADPPLSCDGTFGRHPSPQCGETSVVSHAAHSVQKCLHCVSRSPQKSEPGRGVAACNSGEVSPGGRPPDPCLVQYAALFMHLALHIALLIALHMHPFLTLTLDNGGFVQLAVEQ